MNVRQGTERGKGIPRSEEERWHRHEELYPGTPLPERGTRLSGDLAPGSAAIVILAIIAIIACGMALKKK